MIKVLGARRLFVLLLLIGVNGFLAGALYYYLIPEQITLDRQLRSARSKAADTQADIDKMQVEFEKLQEQEAVFNRLENDGFLGRQNRREAEILFEDIQKESKVFSAVASVRAARVDENEVAAKADHVILTSPVEITVEAIDDLDVYRYVSMLFDRFPGHLSVDNIFMSRKMDISNPVLRGISGGKDIALIEATIKMSWRTMVPGEEVSAIMREQKARRDR